jgi:uncharacterized protein (DUF305 family)
MSVDQRPMTQFTQTFVLELAPHHHIVVDMVKNIAETKCCMTIAKINGASLNACTYRVQDLLLGVVGNQTVII